MTVYVCVWVNNLDLNNFRKSKIYGVVGPHGAAREMLEKYLASSQDISIDVALYGLGRLGDLSTGMNDTSTTLRWAGIFLSLALNCKDKLRTMQAF
jgi:hypothetical protein